MHLVESVLPIPMSSLLLLIHEAFGGLMAVNEINREKTEQWYTIV